MHFLAILGTFGLSGHFLTFLGTLGTSGQFWALFGTFCLVFVRMHKTGSYNLLKQMLKNILYFKIL